MVDREGPLQDSEKGGSVNQLPGEVTLCSPGQAKPGDREQVTPIIEALGIPQESNRQDWWFSVLACNTCQLTHFMCNVYVIQTHLIY